MADLLLGCKTLPPHPGGAPPPPPPPPPLPLPLLGTMLAGAVDGVRLLPPIIIVGTWAVVEAGSMVGAVPKDEVDERWVDGVVDQLEPVAGARVML